MSILTDKVCIVVLIALAEEYEIFQQIFPHTLDHSSDRIICLEHECERNDVRLISILAEQMGAQSAASSAEYAIRNFSPSLIVVLGIAGGVSSDISLGDVCVSNEILDVLQNNKISESKGVQEISFAPDFYNVDAELISTFAFLSAHPSLRVGYDNWRLEACQEAEHLDCGLPDSDLPKILIGPLACGPVSASPKFNEKLKALHRKVTAIETESGGVFQRVAQSRVPAIAVRGISDMADADKNTLEQRTKGNTRKLAMVNATTLLKLQLKNQRFLNVAIRHSLNVQSDEAQLFPARQVQESIVEEIERETVGRLKELSADFRSRPNGFYLPIPRARRTSYAEELEGEEIEEPINIVECLRKNQRTLLRMPRTFPNQALGWTLAHSLLRQQLDGRVVLPFVISGSTLRPPKSGLEAAIPINLRLGAHGAEFIRVFIIEEPAFDSRSRMKFLIEEIAATDAKILVITKAEDSIAAIDDFVRECSIESYELAPISFSETAFFLERTFDMNPREAEAVAIRLDDTFRKFRLDAHPTYFAGLQEETIAALISANKRAELIQLAVDGLLSLIVASDNSRPTLRRTTRERFLKKLVIAIACTKTAVTDEALSQMARDFLRDHAFDLTQTQFLQPFLQNGLLYQAEGTIHFTHPYVESYLLALAMRESPELARTYFDCNAEAFNYYAFDLYCELGPDNEVVRSVREFAEKALETANSKYRDDHIYQDTTRRLTALSTSRQLGTFTEALVAHAKKMESEDGNEDVRAEKQKQLDAQRGARNQLRTEVNSRDPGSRKDLPEDIQVEFGILDNLSRGLTLCSMAVGSGSESLEANEKTDLSKIALSLAAKFSDVWTRNRLRIDFDSARNDLLADANIWKYIEETEADPKSFSAVKRDLELFMHGMELNAILEPMGRVLWRITATAGVKVLAPIVQAVHSSDEIEEVIRAAWYLEVDPAQGKDNFKKAIADYKGSPLLRLVLASHLLARVFWHHYKTAGSVHFIASANRALAPIGLSPTPDRVEQAKRGPNAATD